MLAGCSWFANAPRKEVPPPVAVPQATSEDVLKVYFQTLSALISNDPARQADVFYEVEREYKKTLTTTSRLRYALALIMPNHAGTKLGDGKRILEALLNDPDRLSSTERTFAEILYSQVNARLKSETEDRRVIATLEERLRAQASSDKRAVAQRDEEIARLKRALTEVEQKLDALKEIERSQFERPPTPPGNRDTPSETQSPPAGR
jgi:predicted nucleic acid-binding protein